MEELIRVSGIPLGPVRLMGAEIVFQSDAVGNGRGRVWLPLDASNHLIYGKNGVGKSTVVESLRCVLTGEAPSINARIDLFAAFANLDHLEDDFVTLLNLINSLR
jgi:hypothetical protein